VTNKLPRVTITRDAITIDALRLHLAGPVTVKAGDTPHTNHVTMTIMAGAVDIRALEE